VHKTDSSSRLPPLNALRGFEAAARHSSFAKAADELALTQSAVSHQVRQLEAALGQRLFNRLPREITLTDAGKDFLETVRQALEVLNVGVARLAPYKSTGSLIVSADAAFARFWLLPRLAAFRRQRPDIEVWLDTSERLTDFDRQEVEFVVGRLRSLGGDRTEEPMFDDYLGPCLAANHPSARRMLRVEELASLTLVHDERRENWLVWLRAVGARGVDANRGPRFSDPGLALEVACGGQGIALVSDVLATDDLSSGRLIAPFDQWIAAPHEYRFAYPLRLARDDAVLSFAAYLRTEVKNHTERLESLRARARIVASLAMEPTSGTAP
jgi:LysR family transcriptional regulator, glycine cleavage system transcriptional activator